MRTERACVQCGVTYWAARSDSRMCSSRCRKAAALGHPPTGPSAPVAEGPGPVEVEARQLLRIYGHDPEADELAMAAVRTAQAIDSPVTPASALSPLCRSLMDTMRYLRPEPDGADLRKRVFTRRR